MGLKRLGMLLSEARDQRLQRGALQNASRLENLTRLRDGRLAHIRSAIRILGDDSPRAEIGEHMPDMNPVGAEGLGELVLAEFRARSDAFQADRFDNALDDAVLVH